VYVVAEPFVNGHTFPDTQFSFKRHSALSCGQPSQPAACGRRTLPLQSGRWRLPSRFIIIAVVCRIVFSIPVLFLFPVCRACRPVTIPWTCLTSAFSYSLQTQAPLISRDFYRKLMLLSGPEMKAGLFKEIHSTGHCMCVIFLWLDNLFLLLNPLVFDSVSIKFC
jgi:hypothetical protein